MATIDPTEHAPAPPHPLGELIAREKAEIIERWLEIVVADAERGGHHVAPTELRNALDDYLERLALALPDPEQRGDAAGAGSAAWAEVAREHAVTRVRLGFDIRQLVHEFIVLREVISSLARERGLLTEVADVERLGGLIDAAIAVAVQTYVRSRDYEARRREAEHIGFVTHELRNPLGTARLAAARLRRDPAGPSAARSLEILERSLGRLAELIDGVLHVERLEAGRVECRSEDVMLQPLLEEAIGAAREVAAQKGLRLELPDDRSIMIHADPRLTVSALQNVIDNALKFTDEGEIRVTIEEQASQVVLHVADNCDGLSREEIATIFEPFRRGRSAKPGTGLGLAIARSAVETQGGEITVGSPPSGRGCRFSITLPRARH